MMRKIGDIYPKALVTGASRGLGLAYTEMLIDEGVEVWGTSRNMDTLPKTNGFQSISVG